MFREPEAAEIVGPALRMVKAAVKTLAHAHGDPRVVEVERMTPRMRRIRIAGEAPAGLSWTPGQHVRLLIGDGRGLLGGVLRTYSIWRHDPAREAVDLIGYDHGGDAPGASWVRSAAPGQEISFTRPEGSFVAKEAPYHVFAGEETASVAFGAMLRALPARHARSRPSAIRDSNTGIVIGRRTRRGP